jgi:hypothetical protein
MCPPNTPRKKNLQKNWPSEDGGFLGNTNAPAIPVAIRFYVPKIQVQWMDKQTDTLSYADKTKSN